MDLNQTNFSELKSSDKILLIDFWAEWCGPCRQMSVIINELIEQYKDSDNFIICKCDVDTETDIANEFKIRNIPTLVLTKNGEVLNKIVGLTSKQTIIEKIEGVLNPPLEEN